MHLRKVTNEKKKNPGVLRNRMIEQKKMSKKLIKIF